MSFLQITLIFIHSFTPSLVKRQLWGTLQLSSAVAQLLKIWTGYITEAISTQRQNAHHFKNMVCKHSATSENVHPHGIRYVFLYYRS